jgi:hypothetical protein
MPLQSVLRGRGDVRVGPLAGAGKLNFELDRQGLNTRQPFDRLLGIPLFREAIHRVLSASRRGDGYGLKRRDDTPQFGSFHTF